MKKSLIIQREAVTIDYNNDSVEVNGIKHELYEPHGCFSIKNNESILHIAYGHETILVISDDGTLLKEEHTR